MARPWVSDHPIQAPHCPHNATIAWDRPTGTLWMETGLEWLWGALVSGLYIPRCVFRDRPAWIDGPHMASRTHPIQTFQHLAMPCPLTVRRERAFRPTRYTERHRHVARLLVIGRTRQQIAAATGYSVAHVSRITAMPQVREEVAQHLTQMAMMVIPWLNPKRIPRTGMR